MCLLNKHLLLREHLKRVNMRFSPPSSTSMSPPSHGLNLIRTLSALDYNDLFIEERDEASVKHIPNSNCKCSENVSWVNELEKHMWCLGHANSSSTTNFSSQAPLLLSQANQTVLTEQPVCSVHLTTSSLDKAFNNPKLASTGRSQECFVLWVSCHE